MNIAVILGGGNCVWEDFNLTNVQCAEHQLTIFAINDLISLYQGDVHHAVTLHPNKLARWLTDREGKRYSKPIEVWSHRAYKDVTRVSPDWGGSSGLFATRIALLNLNFERVILCGVPMTVEHKHIVREQDWSDCVAFRKAWIQRIGYMKHKVRSMSGWTAELLGMPNSTWLAGVGDRQHS